MDGRQVESFLQSVSKKELSISRMRKRVQAGQHTRLTSFLVRLWKIVANLPSCNAKTMIAQAVETSLGPNQIEASCVGIVMAYTCPIPHSI